MISADVHIDTLHVQHVRVLIFSHTMYFGDLRKVGESLSSYNPGLGSRLSFNLAGYMVSMIRWLRTKVEWSVISLANVVFVWIVLLAVSGQFVSPLVAGYWQLVDRTFTLERFGGNDVLLINSPVSELDDSWYKNWTSAAASFCCTGLLQCVRIHVPMRLIYGVTCQYIVNVSHIRPTIA